MSQTIFDKIISGEVPAYIVWEDSNYLAFLTPFATTPGQTVVIPKINQGPYVFDLDQLQIAMLMNAVQTVAKLLERSLGVQKVAMVFEGEGVPHVHAKLYPMHGHLEDASNQSPKDPQFFEQYPGFISTIEGPMMQDERLRQIQKQITEARDS